MVGNLGVLGKVVLGAEVAELDGTTASTETVVMGCAVLVEHL